MRSYLVSQFGQPRGVVGQIAGLSMAYKNRARSAWAVSQLQVQPGDHILEIGFGPGITIQHLARLAKEGFVAGIDHSETMVQQAHERNTAAIRAGRVALRQGSVVALPYADEAFDTVIAINSLMFWPDPVANLCEVWRVLKVGGTVAIVQQPRLTREATAAQTTATTIAQQVSAAGFAQVHSTIKLLQPQAVVCVRGTRSDHGLQTKR